MGGFVQTSSSCDETNDPEILRQTSPTVLTEPHIEISHNGIRGTSSTVGLIDCHRLILTDLNASVYTLYIIHYTGLNVQKLLFTGLNAQMLYMELGLNWMGL